MREDETELPRIRLDRPDTTVGAAPSASAEVRLARPTVGSALRLRAAGVVERLADAARRDLDAGTALPGLVVLFAVGIALYFQLPQEPWPPAPILLAAVAVIVTAIRRRAGHPARLAASVAAVALGVAVASVETRRVAAPRLDHERTVTVEGRVVELDATAKGGLRLTVDVVRMEGRGLTPATTPTRISATLTVAGSRPGVGDGIRFKARLKPPEGPVMPGGYDFARRAWFEGRGAGGYILGRTTPVDLGPADRATEVIQGIATLRHTIADRVRAALPGATGTIAAALMVGEQRAIPESAAEPLRASGLTHIVSISGLHMGLVAGAVIVAVRAVAALFPVLALAFPIKKWAAFAAFVVATIYLVLSGNQVAALRSHLMLSVALLAVLVDRPAITMHTVAVSAVLILAIDPSAAMEPSFQMSYLAVIALVAAYDLHREVAARRPPRRDGAGPLAHLLGAGLRHVEGFAVSSLVAGLATAPVIAGVFFRAAPYSILANMAVLPVTGLVIMPAAVVAALAMPFGLDSLPLRVMGLGIDWMVAVGRWTADLPGGSGSLGAPHPAMMPLGIAAVLWLSMWKSRIRLVGLAFAVAAVALLAAGPRPDVMIGRHGAPVAVRGGDGRLHVLAGPAERFDTGIWLAADRDPRSASAADLGEGWRCDPLGCVHRLPTVPPPSAGGPRSDAAAADTAVGGAATVRSDEEVALEVAVVRHPLGFAEDCRRAALIVTPLVAPPGCRDLTAVVDRLDLARLGAVSLDFVGPVRPIAAASPEAGASDDLDTARPTDPSRRDATAMVDPTRDPDDPPPRRASPRSTASAPAPHLATTASGDAASAKDAVPDPPLPQGLRRDVRIHASLPAASRPWTPIDPRIAELAREAEDADTAARMPADATATEPDEVDEDARGGTTRPGLNTGG